jgi:hypothetical protein
MIERVTARTFFCKQEHHPLRIKNDLRAPVEDMKAAASHSSPPRAVRDRVGRKETSPHLQFEKW